MTVAHDALSVPGALIFDIDRITEKSIDASWDGLDGELEALHAGVWDVFDAAKGEKLERLLSGGAPE